VHSNFIVYTTQRNLRGYNLHLNPGRQALPFCKKGEEIYGSLIHASNLFSPQVGRRFPTKLEEDEGHTKIIYNDNLSN
jgi:hypothetical protein